MPVQWLIFGDEITQETAHLWVEAGANGYAWKGDLPILLVAALQMMQQGQRWFSPNLKAEPGLGLTPDERQLLAWLIQGRTNKWIARQTRLSLRMVNYHFTHLYTKLGVNGRAEAAAWAARKGVGR